MGGIMRDGILEGLPKTLSSDGIVFLAIAPKAPNTSSLRSLIDQLDHKKKWIKLVNNDQVSPANIPAKSVVVLTLNVTRSSLVNARHAADAIGAYCPLQALTVSEVMGVLQALSERREQPAAPSTAADRKEDINEIALTTTLSAPAQQTPNPEQSREGSSEVQNALATLATCRTHCEEVGLAVLMVQDQLTRATNECDTLRQELRAAHETSQRLETEKSTLTTEKQRLSAEVGRLQGIVDGFAKLLNGAK
jgi:hypothetical protein